MKEESKKNILDKYKIALQKGEHFWPDSIYKDLIVSFAIFIVLILLATFMGIPGDPKADPSDTAYIPRPEWYFLFLFKFLAIYGQIPLLGKVEWVAAILIPVAAILALVLLPFFDKNPHRHYSRRAFALTVMGVVLADIIVLTMIANIPVLGGSQGFPVMSLLQILAGLVIPGLALLALFVLAFVFKGKTEASVHVMPWIGGVAAVVIIVLAGIVLIAAPPAAAGPEVQVANTLTEKILLGQDLYSVNCVECHGADGEGGEVKGVKGFENVILLPIHTKDIMYTFTDETLANIIAYGQQEKEHAMPPFGRAYGGELSPSDIDYLVTYLRYTWDDRAELPAEAAAGSTIPALVAGEVPSYDIHIQPLTKRYCISCHRAGKENNNYLMGSYEDMLKTGDNVPLITAGDKDSLLLQLINGHESKDPKTGKAIRQMPPTRLLDPKYIDMLTRWIMAGMPKTEAEAKALSVTATPTVAAAGTGTPAPLPPPSVTPTP